MTDARQTGTAFATPASGEEAVVLTLRRVRETLRVPCAVAWIHEEGAAPMVQGSAEASDWIGSAERSPLIRLLCNWVVRTGEPTSFADAREHPVGGIVADPEFERFAFAGVPLLAGHGDVVGALAAVDPGSREWSAADLEALEQLARQIVRPEGGVGKDAPARAEQPSADDAVRSMLELSPLPMWVFDSRTLAFLAVNEPAARLYGYPAEELLARTVTDLLPRGTPAEVADAVRPAPDGRPTRVAVAQAKRDGETIHVVITTTPVAFAAREAALALVVDVTETRRISETYRFLAEASALLTTSLDYRERLSNLARLSVPRLADYCIVDVVEDDGSTSRVEAAHADPAMQELVRELLRFPPFHFRSGGVAEVLRTGELALIDRLDETFLRTAAQSSEHLECVRRLRPRSCLIVPLTVRGRVVGAITFVMSDSRRRFHPSDVDLASELARRAAVAIDNARLYRRAQQAIRAREEVLSVVSHELRNPLSATALTLDLLLEVSREELSPTQSKRLESIRWFTSQMTSLVDDLMDIARLEAGQLVLRSRRQSVRMLVNEAIASVQPMAESRSISLAAELSDEVPDVRVDRARVLQVFGNLLANAIRAGAPGDSIVIRAHPVADGQVQFVVSDTGPGMSEEELAALFDRKTLDQSPRPGGGLGMGLAIASGIVRAHGGEIWAASAPDEGTSFFFTIPVDGLAEADDGETGEHDLPVLQSLYGPDRTRSSTPASPASPARSRPERSPAGTRRAPGELLEELAALGRAQEEPASDPESLLREWITRALHLGHLRPGDRLPSIRGIVDACGVSKHTIVRAYRRLEAEGLVETRERSGMYVADPNRMHADTLMEAGEWLAGVLGEACELQLRVPILPGLIERWTSAVRLVCACVESDSDHLHALCSEYSGMFGFDSVPVSADTLPVLDRLPDRLIDPDDLPEAVRSADLLLTTPFHAPIARAIAEALRKPLIVATADTDAVAAVEQRLRSHPTLTLVCKDPRFGERVRALHGTGVRVVHADELEALKGLEHGDPVLLTQEARQSLGNMQFRLLTPRFPSFSLETARELARLVVHLNITGERRLNPLNR